MTSKVVAFDLCEHRYTKPCVEVGMSWDAIFGRKIMELMISHLLLD